MKSKFAFSGPDRFNKILKFLSWLDGLNHQPPFFNFQAPGLRFQTNNRRTNYQLGVYCRSCDMLHPALFDRSLILKVFRQFGILQSSCYSTATYSTATISCSPFGGPLCERTEGGSLKFRNFIFWPIGGHLGGLDKVLRFGLNPG